MPWSKVTWGRGVRMDLHREYRRPPSKGTIKGEMEEKNLNPVDNGGEGYTLGQRRPVGIKAWRCQPLGLLTLTRLGS